MPLLEAERSPLSWAETPLNAPVQDNDKWAIEAKITQIARNSDVDPDLFLAIAKAESSLDPRAKSEQSSAKGLFQILDGTWEENECEGDPLDENDNIKCAVKIYKEKGFAPWISSVEMWDIATSTRDEIGILCSCMAGLNSWGLKIKGDAIDIVPNSRPVIGGVALFRYGNIGHAALITGFTKTGIKIKETNYKNCQYTEREVDLRDNNLYGFYAVPK